MHLTSKMTDPKNRFHNHWKFPGEINLTDKMNLTDDYETSLSPTESWLKYKQMAHFWD